MKNKNLIIIGVVALAIALRVWGLGLNPVGLVHDEIHQLVNAKSIWLTGKGAAGTGAGIFQNQPYCDGNCVFGELPSFLLVPFAIFKSVFPWLKLPLVLASVVMMIGFMKFFENLTKNKTVGILVGLMIAINPWAINFGRTAYENVLAFMFYAWSFYFLTKNKFKLKDQIIGIFLGLAASLCYFGAKPIFVPLMWAGLGYGWWKEKKNNKKYVILGILTVLVMVGYGLILKNSFAGLRMNETKVINSEIIGQVDDQRRMSLEVPKVRDIFINKYTVVGKVLLKRYFAGLAPNYLFNEGELGYDHFMITNHPFMYLIDLPMIIVGFYGLAMISLPAAVLIGGIILILPITPMVSNYATTYALRSGLTYPILAAMAGIGIYFLIKKIKNKKGKRLVGLGILIIYLISLMNFEVMYWYRNPFEKSAGWVFFEREAIKYIQLVKESKNPAEIEIVTTDPVDMIYEYAIFSGEVNNKDFIEKMNETIKNRSYQIDGIKFSKTCPEKIDNQKIYLMASNQACIKEPNHLARIAEPRDAGTRWAIPNEVLCKEIKLPQYPYPRKIADFNIEKMTRENFCKLWISQPL
jgi:hypothetical protein